MKHSLIFALAFLPAALPAAGHDSGLRAGNPYRDFAGVTAKAPVRISPRLRVLPVVANAPATTDVRKPASVIRSKWDGMDWQDYARYTFTYDTEGRTLTESAENLNPDQTQYYTYSRVEYNYDEQGRLFSSQVFAGFSLDKMQLVKKTETTFDPVLTDVVTEQNSYDILDDGTEELNADSFKRIIERDAEGRVISMHAFTWYDGGFLEVEALETEYAADGTPLSLTESVITQKEEGGALEMAVASAYTDCTWFESDGQIISLDDITASPNRLKSASVDTAEQTGIKMTIEYPGDEYDFISRSEYTYVNLFPTVTVMSYKELDYGGFYSKTVTDQDLTPAGVGPVQSIDQSLNLYDQYGHLLEAQDQTFYGHTIINSWSKGRVTLDKEGGLPVTYVRSNYEMTEEDDYNGTWEDDFRLTYESWTDPASAPAIDSADNGDSQAPVEYYDLQGRRLSPDATGLVIRRQGNEVSKVIKTK